MATMRSNPRVQVGSTSWISEERTSAVQIAEAEAEEFTFSARNEIEWLNEHMAEIFSKNEVNVAEIFKTPGKLRGKTPRTIRKNNPLEGRAPLSDVFSSTPRGAPSPFRQAHFRKPMATFTVAEDEPGPLESQVSTQIPQTVSQKPAANFLDSGYYGSQLPDATQPTQLNEAIEDAVSPRGPTPPPKDDIIEESPVHDAMDISEEAERRTTEGSFKSAKEEQMQKLIADNLPKPEAETWKAHGEPEEATRPVLEWQPLNRAQTPDSPHKQSPERPAAVESPPKLRQTLEEPAPAVEDEPMDDVRSPSEGSSPIRPVVRKSSLNFASLPAREPITTKKSIGNRVSRTSQLDQTRTSHYGRQTGGKSLGNSRQDGAQDEHDDQMDTDFLDKEGNDRDDLDCDSKISRLHNKTSTQRLQDQISMLGKSQSNVRPSKSIANTGTVSSQSTQPSQAPAANEVPQAKSPARSPQRQNRPFVAPGAFPEDEDDSWIGPPTAAQATEPSVFSPRPQMVKYHSADVMECIHAKDSIGGSQFNIPKRGEEQRHRSPLREQPSIPERTTSTLGHIKSVSTSVLRSPKKAGESLGHKTAISVSNPNPSLLTEEAESIPLSKSPSRSYRGSPLKAAKDKFSSILKTSRGLFASSAAVSAEAKTSALSPSSIRMGMNSVQSFEEALHSQSPYPNVNAIKDDQQIQNVPNSPGTASVRKTRASTEREERRKEQEAKEVKESKEARKMAEQLEKARAKVKEEAHVHHLEQERVAAMQREIAARKGHNKLAKASQVDVPRATRSSPRKTKAQLEAEGVAAAAASVDELSKDTEMSNTSAMPPPAVPRPKSQIGRPPAKRPLKPAKDPLTKSKQPPTFIRVDTGSQRGHQYHPSNTTLAATLQESLTAPAPASSSQGMLRNKASTSSIQSKASTSSFKTAATKALEAAARKKEQDELAVQRKREAKLDIERQRAAIKEEERRKEEQQRRQDAARQRETQREREQSASLADAKKSASRQATEKRRLEMEKAKQTGAPPPAIRPQPGEDLASSIMQEKALPPAPPQRADAARMNASVQRPQDDVGKSGNSVLHNTAKAPPKRPLQQDADEHHSRPTMPRNPPSYQHNETHTKRRKTSENLDNDDDEDMTEDHPKMKAPPIRQSSSRPKEMPTKSLFPSGYAPAPQPGNLQRSTLISQHNLNQSKPAHPMDMAQVSKAPIAFGPNSSQSNSQSHKTPARPGAPANGGKSIGKSAARSSPRYQNGENIELPEINTDSEDDDDNEKDDFVPLAWANSPALRTQLAKQETIDPSEVFGQPGALNMEEVFPKSKDRFHKFRARTSSANWSGQDRLTEDEIRKDLEARDRVRRQGGWTYDSMV